MNKNTFCKFSFNRQMSEIAGEVIRLLKRSKIIKDNNCYIGEYKVIRHLFKLMKDDPKNKDNKDKMQLIEYAENNYLAYMNDQCDAPTADQLIAFWTGYIEAYIDEVNI